MGNIDKKRAVSHLSSFWICVIIFLLAFCVRCIYLYDSSDNPTFSTPIIDSQWYDEIARNTAQGEGLTGRQFFWQHFFYPFFLSVTYFFSKSSILCAKVIHMFLGSLGCVLTYRLGERIFCRTAGIIAGGITAFYGPLIFFVGELLANSWTGFWAVVLIWLLLKSAENKSVKLCLVLGLCAGLSVITRANFIPFLLAAQLWLSVVWIRQHIRFDKFLLLLASVIVGFSIVAIPVAAKNYQTTRRFSLLPGHGGMNVYMGNNPDFEAVSIRPGSSDWKKIVDLPLEEGLQTAAEKRHFYYAKTFEYMQTQPISFFKGILHKAVQFTSSRELPGSINLYLFTRWSSLLGLLVWKVGSFGFPFGVLLPLALLGVFFYRRKIPIPIMLFIILYPATVILTHCDARYRTPVIMPMCILAAAAIVRVGEIIHKKNWPHILISGIFGICVAFVCSASGPFYSERHIDYEAELHSGMGYSLTARGQRKEAIEAYSKALVLKPDYVEIHENIGLLLADERQFDKAIKHFKLALQIEPDNAKTHNILAVALRAQGKLNEAISHCRRALDLAPNDAGALYNLALFLQLQGKLNEAVSSYRKVLQLNPDSAELLNSLAWILATAEDTKFRNPNEALELARKACKLTNYQQPQMLDTLAAAYAAADDFQKAIETAEKAAQLAVSAGNRKLAGKIQGRIELYKADRPCRDQMPTQNELDR